MLLLVETAEMVEVMETIILIVRGAEATIRLTIPTKTNLPMMTGRMSKIAMPAVIVALVRLTIRRNAAMWAGGTLRFGTASQMLSSTIQRPWSVISCHVFL